MSAARWVTSEESVSTAFSAVCSASVLRSKPCPRRWETANSFNRSDMSVMLLLSFETSSVLMRSSVFWRRLQLSLRRSCTWSRNCLTSVDPLSCRFSRIDINRDTLESSTTALIECTAICASSVKAFRQRSISTVMRGRLESVVSGRRGMNSGRSTSWTVSRRRSTGSSVCLGSWASVRAESPCNLASVSSRKLWALRCRAEFGRHDSGGCGSSGEFDVRSGVRMDRMGSCLQLAAGREGGPHTLRLCRAAWP
mmetsp:Transcript_21286/g.66710  ORF Transcript_21286/g.66710 Transcript_21286/m.66710 type:complete len:253 (+) Transcript_21286:1282-2040(+)